jgi:hypothetical protein
VVGGDWLDESPMRKALIQRFVVPTDAFVKHSSLTQDARKPTSVAVAVFFYQVITYLSSFFGFLTQRTWVAVIPRQ